MRGLEVQYVVMVGKNGPYFELATLLPFFPFFFFFFAIMNDFGIVSYMINWEIKCLLWI